MSIRDTVLRVLGYGCFSVGCIWWLGCGTGWYHSIRLQAHVTALRQQVAELREHCEQLRLKKQRYNTAGDATHAVLARQAYAREHLQLGLPNEVIYHVDVK